jgi:hypothetical protein
VIALVAAAVLLVSDPPARTTLHVYSPWAGSIPALGVTIDRTVRGSCSRGSEMRARSDAWRCAAGGTTYDPCFSNDRVEVGAHVLCMSSPWEDATAVELTRGLPLGRANSDTSPERSRPWAIVTAAGERCPLARRGLGAVGGLPVTYACAGSALLLGLPTRGSTWTQEYVPSIAAKAPRRVALRSVWW